MNSTNQSQQSQEEGQIVETMPQWNSKRKWKAGIHCFNLSFLNKCFAIFRVTTLMMWEYTPLMKTIIKWREASNLPVTKTNQTKVSKLFVWTLTADMSGELSLNCCSFHLTIPLWQSLWAICSTTLMTFTPPQSQLGWENAHLTTHPKPSRKMNQPLISNAPKTIRWLRRASGIPKSPRQTTAKPTTHATPPHVHWSRKC